MKGSKLLKVSSILMIIGGIIGAVFSVILILGAVGITALSSNPEMQQAASESGLTTGTISAVVWISAIIMVISSVVEIIAGVKGKKNWNNPAMAKSLIILGIVCAVISLVGNILYATADTLSIVSILTGLILPVLYIIGAVQLKKSEA